MDPLRLLENPENGAAVVLDRLIVEMAPGNNVAEAREVAESVGGEIIFEFKTFPGYLFKVDATTSADLEAPLEILLADQRVARVYPDLLVPTSQDGGANSIETLRLDTGYASAYIQAGMEEAWEKLNQLEPTNSEPVVIAIIDSGIGELPSGDNTVDEVLAREFDYDKIAIVDGISGTNPNARHGTSVTSVIAAQNNAAGVPSVPEESFSGIITSVDSIEYYIWFRLLVGYGPARMFRIRRMGSQPANHLGIERRGEP